MKSSACFLFQKAFWSLSASNLFQSFPVAAHGPADASRNMRERSMASRCCSGEGCLASPGAGVGPGWK